MASLSTRNHCPVLSWCTIVLPSLCSCIVPYVGRIHEISIPACVSLLSQCDVGTCDVRFSFSTCSIPVHPGGPCSAWTRLPSKMSTRNSHIVRCDLRQILTLLDSRRPLILQIRRWQFFCRHIKMVRVVPNVKMILTVCHHTSSMAAASCCGESNQSSIFMA